MRVLSIVHMESDPPGLFGDAVAERGHDHDEWLITTGAPPPRAPREYDAVAVFGGDMNVEDEDRYPWLQDEKGLIRDVLRDGTPVLGVCLGSQVLADAASARVSRVREPEIGWYDVNLTAEARHDPLFRTLPKRFPAFQWHTRQFALPSGAVPLARNPVCLQAYRLNETAWGVQFHPEVKPELMGEWLEAAAVSADAQRIGFDLERERALTERNVEGWNEIGRTLFSRFVAVAEGRVEARADSRVLLPRAYRPGAGG